ncbi:endo-1,4-beta-xylanase A precursor [Nonlabens ulvanivorans]|uniref:Endo-1,4-beta-xylanase A n=1 Tax=Nonlabens ulvanivorans TaxID=906888 RepID=A0A090QF90_NONUL|nr:endo-1,4-beta-xylanase A precursor [Nonlabens ulvanivorans]
MLKITALQENFQGAGFTSARMLTKGKYQRKFGRFEARIKLPWGTRYLACLLDVRR